MRKAPIKILLITLITGIICMIGEGVLLLQLDEIQTIHKNIMEESVQNRECMANINMKLYEHQAMLVNYALSDSEEFRKQYAADEVRLREDIAGQIIDFSYRMKGGEREKIYHRVYSDYSSYEENTSLFLAFIQNGERDMAIYYNDNVLKTYLNDINTKLADLDELTQIEISTAEQRMDQAVKTFYILRYVIMIIVVTFIIVCIYMCVKITYGLDHYKEELEEKLIEKNRALQKHNENMIKMQGDVIFSMANLIESRDNETGEHVKRTSTYVEMIAREAKKQGIYEGILTEPYIERLVKVAPLHDVGKISVPDHILLKPGKLTVEEFEQIKLHAARGREIIQELFGEIEDKEYIDMARDVAEYHHERWNGDGYAKGLAGEEIPLSARIMAIADVFDALISKRRYKEAFSLDKAFEIMRESGGSHFDPRLTEVFLSIRGEIEKYLGERAEL